MGKSNEPSVSIVSLTVELQELNLPMQTQLLQELSQVTGNRRKMKQTPMQKGRSNVHSYTLVVIIYLFLSVKADEFIW